MICWAPGRTMGANVLPEGTGVTYGHETRHRQKSAPVSRTVLRTYDSGSGAAAAAIVQSGACATAGRCPGAAGRCRGAARLDGRTSDRDDGSWSLFMAPSRILPTLDCMSGRTM